jgi:hypothetical protein
MSFLGGQIDFFGGYLIYLVIIFNFSAFDWFPRCLCYFLGRIYDFLGRNMGYPWWSNGFPR